MTEFSQDLFDEIIDIADTPVVGEKRKTTENGVEIVEGDMIEHRRLQIDARKWALGKMNPKKYGDKVGIDHSNTDGTLAGLFASIAGARADGQGVFTLADALGMSGQRSLSGAVRQGGEAKRFAAEFLDTRQAGQGNRLGEAVVDALGTRPAPPGTAIVPWVEQTAEEVAEGTRRAARAAQGRPTMKTADATKATMTAARGKAADAAYDAARKGAGRSVPRAGSPHAQPIPDPLSDEALGDGYRDADRHRLVLLFCNPVP